LIFKAIFSRAFKTPSLFEFLFQPMQPVLASQSNTSRWHLLGLFLLMALVPGCRGCNTGPNEQLSKEELEKRRREQQDALVANDLVSLPTDAQRALVSLKPGHWLETTQRFKSTREDLQVMAVGKVLRGEERVPLPATNFVSEFNRRTVLPKGQEKSIGLQFFVPMAVGSAGRDNLGMDGGSKALFLGTELVAVPLMTPISESNKRSRANELREHEYQLVVLSPQALAYQFLSGLDAIYWSYSELTTTDARVRSYEVSLVEPKNNQYGLPQSLLTMTSVASLVWDDVSPSDLSDDQQLAIVDWLHWGGQLVISGPTSWSRLQNSFLSPYLPGLSADSVELTTDSFAEMSRTWITKDLGKLQTTDPIQIVGPPVAGLKMNLSPRGAWLPGSGELVAESQVGRGRIVVTGFPLREPRIYRWPYYSSFFSTGILRRWPRTFRRSGSMGDAVQSWAAPFAAHDLDARMHSNLRILSRDLPKLTRPTVVGSTVSQEPSVVTTEEEIARAAQVESPDETVTFEKLKKNYEPFQWDGAGAWSDYTGTADDAVESLRAAAGIELPSRSTILKLLGGYLICLVPLNYLIFRLLRRLEYAWLAAPVLALVGVVVVTRVAQLDIGFARRSINLGVLELYSDHPRGHLTQYLALYTSLSTNYSMEFPEKDSAALPQGDIRRQSRRAQMSTRELRTNYGLSDGVVLEPVTVYSNSTELLRAEQILPLSSTIRLESDEQGGNSIVNGLAFGLQDCLLLRRTQEDSLEFAWLGPLEPSSSKSFQWLSTSLDAAIESWGQSLHTRAVRPEADELTDMEGVWVGGLLDRIARKYPLLPGSTVLIGHTGQQLGDLKISPAQDQTDRSCVVVVHLSAPRLGAVQPDLAIVSRGQTGDSESEESENEDSEAGDSTRDVQNGDLTE
jgi:hypothetical protein